MLPHPSTHERQDGKKHGRGVFARNSSFYDHFGQKLPADQVYGDGAVFKADWQDDALDGVQRLILGCWPRYASLTSMNLSPLPVRLKQTSCSSITSRCPHCEWENGVMAGSPLHASGGFVCLPSYSFFLFSPSGTCCLALGSAHVEHRATPHLQQPFSYIHPASSD